MTFGLSLTFSARIAETPVRDVSIVHVLNYSSPVRGVSFPKLVAKHYWRNWAGQQPIGTICVTNEAYSPFVESTMYPELPTIPGNSVWFYIVEELSECITAELRSEIAPQHPLFSISENLVVIAKCGANDDVLALNPGDNGHVFCVHLTWAGKHDLMPTKIPSFVQISNAELTQFFATY